MAENRVNSHAVYDYDLHRQLKFLQKREKRSVTTANQLTLGELINESN